MKKKLAILLVGTMIASSILAGCGSKKSEPTKKETSGELKGDITFWHSFTQGPRMEVIQQTADQFMKDNPGVKIKIETFSWGDFYTKWTTGLASGNSVLWTLGSLAGQLIIGFTGALAINRVNFGKGIYRTLMIIPWAFPSIVIALSWKWILNGVSGFIPNILVQLGICNELPQFLSDNSFVFLTLIFINIWFGAPMIMVNVLSALQTIPQDQYEAAQIDGASKVQQFWYITVPHIKVVVGLLVVLRTIWVFNNFDIIYLLTGGGPANATTTMPIYAYNMGWNTKLLGRSSAVTMLLLAFLLLVCVIYFTIIGKWEKEDK